MGFCWEMWMYQASYWMNNNIIIKILIVYEIKCYWNSRSKEVSDKCVCFVNAFLQFSWHFV